MGEQVLVYGGRLDELLLVVVWQRRSGRRRVIFGTPCFSIAHVHLLQRRQFRLTMINVQLGPIDFHLL
jgi:hypothetical protein